MRASTLGLFRIAAGPAIPGWTPCTLVLLLLFGWRSAPVAKEASPMAQLTSPDGRTGVELRLSDAGAVTYSVHFNRTALIREAPLGVALDEGGALTQGLRVQKVERRSRDRTEAIFPGKTSSLRDHLHEVTV